MLWLVLLKIRNHYREEDFSRGSVYCSIHCVTAKSMTVKLTDRNDQQTDFIIQETKVN